MTPERYTMAAPETLSAEDLAQLRCVAENLLARPSERIVTARFRP